MSILIDSNTRLVVQGLTGTEGKFHAAQMIDYGTQVVAGVTPGRGGQTCLDRPVFNTMREAVDETEANASCIFVPPAFAADAALEAFEAGLGLVVVITEGIPTLQMVDVYWEAKRRGARLIGPNCPGIITPGQSKIGIMPGHIHKPGKIGLISRSGTLNYEFVNELALGNYGNSTCVGIGGDPIVGAGFVDLLELFNADPQTEGVVLVGEIGGTDEEKAADYVRDNVKKPVVGFVAGHTAPPGKRMGHAGAIISGGRGTAAEKISAFKAADIRVCERPDQICKLFEESGIVPLA